MGDAQTQHPRLAQLAGNLGLHEHRCLIYDTQEEQFASALPFLSVGLERDEKCILLANEKTAALVVQALREAGTDVDRQRRKGPLAVITKNDVLKTGRFDPDLVIGFWIDAVTQAKADGFPALRVLAEMSWVGEHIDTGSLIEYESKLNPFVRDHDAVIVCQYNRARYSAGVILGVLRMHPLVVSGDLVSKNPYYVSPDELLKPNQAALEVERLLKNILEWEQAQQTLRRSEERWRSVFANWAIGVALTDLDGRFLAANPVYQKMVGYSEEELRALSFLDVTHEDYREAHGALATELLEGKRQQFQIEIAYRRKDGTLIWVRNNVSLVPGSERVPRSVMALSEDITERKVAEEALRAAMEERARLSALRAEIAMVLANKDNLRGCLHKCADTLVRYLEAAFARIWTLDTERGELVLEASAGMYPRLDGRFSRIPLGEIKVGRIARERKGHLTNDVQNDPRIIDRDWAFAEKMQSFAGYPLVVEDRVVGVMAMFSREALSPSTLEALSFIADGIAQGIEGKRAEEEIERLRSQLELERDYLREELDESQAFGEILGRSPALQRVLSQIKLVAPTEANVLILGESGTGKELVARAIHRLSPRSSRPLIKVNCGSIPRELFESEFFGHVKGAFTGALRDRTGRFELADGGTLFLDEVSEIPLELQSKLLRVLQEGEFERVGEESTRHANVRVIAATNRDLQSEVEAGRFRLDLYHRLAVFPIQVPPLRERREDIPILAAHFLEKICARSNLPRPRLRQRDIEVLQRYDWPGNVRELQNVIERAVILARGGPLRFDLPPGSRPQQAGSAIQIQPSTEEGEVLTDAEWRQKERENLRKALRRAGGKISGPGGAAEILGVHANTLVYRLRVLGLKK